MSKETEKLESPMRFGTTAGAVGVGAFSGVQVNPTNLAIEKVVSNTVTGTYVPSESGSMTESITAGAGIDIDNTDPKNPIISSTVQDDLEDLQGDLIIGVYDEGNGTYNKFIKDTGIIEKWSGGVKVGEYVPSESGNIVESIVAGDNITIDDTDPLNPVISSTAQIDSIVAGNGITIDNTDVNNPIISTSYSNVVNSVVEGSGVTVDVTDPENPVISTLLGGINDLSLATVITAGSNALRTSHIARENMPYGWIFNDISSGEVVAEVGGTNLICRGDYSLIDDTAELYESTVTSSDSSARSYFPTNPTVGKSIRVTDVGDGATVLVGSRSSILLTPENKWALSFAVRPDGIFSGSSYVVGKAGSNQSLRTGMYIDNSGIINIWMGGVNYNTAKNVTAYIDKILYFYWRNYHNGTTWVDDLYLNGDIVYTNRSTSRGVAVNNVDILFNCRWDVDTHIDSTTDSISNGGNWSYISAFFSYNSHFELVGKYNESDAFHLNPYYYNFEVGVGSSTIEGVTEIAGRNSGWFQLRFEEQRLNKTWLCNLGISGRTAYHCAPSDYVKPSWVVGTRPVPQVSRNITRACQLAPNKVFWQLPGNDFSSEYIESPSGYYAPWMEWFEATAAAAKEASKYCTTFINMGIGPKGSYDGNDSGALRKLISDQIYKKSQFIIGMFDETADSNGVTTAVANAGDDIHYSAYIHREVILRKVNYSLRGLQLLV